MINNTTVYLSEGFIKILGEEVDAAHRKYPVWPENIFEAASIIHEATGELAIELNSKGTIALEVIQIMAACVLFLENWGNYTDLSEE